MKLAGKEKKVYAHASDPLIIMSHHTFDHMCMHAGALEATYLLLHVKLKEGMQSDIRQSCEF